MYKVNAEKLLQEFKALHLKKADACNAIAQTARTFAVNRGYDEQRTAEFIEYVQDLEDYGLTGAEAEKLEFLSAYVEETDDLFVKAIDTEG